MFTVNVGGFDYWFDFEYDNEYNEKMQCDLRVTNCYCFDREGNVVAEGKATCSPKDNFEKNKGRKVALTKAIRKMPRDGRRQTWDAYFAARGKRS